jgi:hypothetical protein
MVVEQGKLMLSPELVELPSQLQNRGGENADHFAGTLPPKGWWHCSKQ